MKIRLTTTAAFSAALLLQASSVFAAPARPADAIIGSDTFDEVMAHLFVNSSITAPAGGGVAGGIGVTAASYLGLGSSVGERQMEGKAKASEMECGPTTDTPTHPGCQEIAPMSRQMGTDICNDPEAAGKAEGLGVCDDGLSVFTNNAAMKGDDAAACTAWTAGSFAQSLQPFDPAGDLFVGTVGDLGVAGLVPTTAYTIGAGGMPAWKDVLRLVYTGCKNTDGLCVATTSRRTRCSDPVRQAVINNWDVIQGGVNCGAAPCAGGLRRAYRRDDGSGTTGVFVTDFLGVTTSLGSRPRVFSSRFQCTTGGAAACCGNAASATATTIAPIPANHSFCDGGQGENFAPDCQFEGGAEVYLQVGGDPIKKPCDANDDLCDMNGQGGVVQAIISTPAQADAFATHQCSANTFRRTNYADPAPVFQGAPAVPPLGACPDGARPTGTLCGMPVHVGANTGNCMEPRNGANPFHNNPAITVKDQRSQNAVRRNAAGAVQVVSVGAPINPAWRMNMYQAVTSSLNSTFGPGFAITPAQQVCVEPNATTQIGCIVSNTTCTIGFAGRTAVYDPSNLAASARNEPFKIENTANPAVSFPPNNDNIGAVAATDRYELQRVLYVNAIGGFENVSADCAARVASTPSQGPTVDAAWCSDQLNIANAFYDINTGSAAFNACQSSGFIPRTAATVTCVGAMGAATCGAPTSQAISACEPL